MTPKYSVLLVYTTRTSVCSEAGSPSKGATCTNPTAGWAFFHAGSFSTSPSSVGGSAILTADTEGRSWALAAHSTIITNDAISPGRTRVVLVMCGVRARGKAECQA